MRMYDLIEKKKRGESLSQPEIQFLVDGYVEEKIPDYQMAAMLMAICFQGMDRRETAWLTLAMEHSGEVVDLSSLDGPTVDKHSTGGVGDKTTLIAAPLAAACGAVVAKMSGRGLGHTGGTIDKLESIPGFRTALSREEFFQVVRKTGLSVIGQTGNLVPADKKMYALRDVTATVDCIPLIASSVMSKKLAAGSQAILLDVKTGSGAFMKTPEEAAKLAEEMVAIGCAAGRRTGALITDMDVPLGRMVGNALEVQEAAQVLQGRGPADLTEVCIALAADMLVLCGLAEPEAEGSETAEPEAAWGKRAEAVSPRRSGVALVRQALADGSGLERLKAMVQAQGGDPQALEHPQRLPQASCRYTVLAPADGYVTHMDTEGIGIASMLLGAGRSRKEDALDYGAGIELRKKTGEPVRAGEPLAVLYAGKERLFPEAEKKLLASYAFGPEPPSLRKHVLARVTEKGITWR